MTPREASCTAIVAEAPQPPLAVAARLQVEFAGRARDLDETDEFPLQNFEALRRAGLLEAGVPAELGGQGLDVAELCGVLRQLAQGCSSTALALAMHTHQVATAAWRWRHEQAPVDGLLRRVAAERPFIASTGGGDWLRGSGTAVRVDGGYRIDATKQFVSGMPFASLISTSAVLAEPDAEPAVLHFVVPAATPGVHVIPNWRGLGMRASGSHEVRFDGVFVPEAAIGVRRPRDRWHPLFHVLSRVAMPLIYAVYVGIAEAARDLVVTAATAAPESEAGSRAIGDIENALHAARLAHADMVETAQAGAPGIATTSRIMIGRTLVGDGCRRTLELAMEAMGGRAFHRNSGLERLFRDVQASRYHPLQADAQRLLAGRVALQRAV